MTQIAYWSYIHGQACTLEKQTLNHREVYQRPYHKQIEHT